MCVDITNRIEECITEKNQRIWDKLTPHYRFQLLLDKNEYSWKAKVEYGFATIVTPTEELSQSSFTHELLHIYVEHLGLSKYEEIVHAISGDESLLILTEGDLIAYIYNFSSHKKMYPYFEEMGFPDDKFVQSKIKFSWLDLFIISLLFKFDKKKPTAVNLFIGHSISLLNNVDPDDQPKCMRYLNKLKRLNPDLYQIIYEFDQQWENCKDLDLLRIFNVFEKRLNKWLISNKIFC